ncbi:hypothetical protein BKA70DRAFT_1441903 [Coprinopsis sp. MPI-PUGE-AT-0042]|nr:hypothetical protein BKA70DRAFT_1441903 [Coprinopsis sp. MPI-PUGE-AT-0042]
MPGIDKTPDWRTKTPGSSVLHNRRKDHEDRVRKASPTADRCIFENMDKDRSVQLCHVLPRSTTKDDGFMESLEINWDMEYWLLNLDTKSNAFFAGAHFHQMFDNGSLILLPSLTDLERLMEPFPSAGLPNYEEDEVFEYKLVPLTNSTKVIHRCTCPEDQLAAGSYTAHFHPFSTLKIKSQVRPHFVVMHIGLQVSASGSGEELKKALEENVPSESVQLINLIHARYTTMATRPDKYRIDEFLQYDDYDEAETQGSDGDDPKDRNYTGRSGGSTKTGKTNRTLAWRMGGMLLPKQPYRADDNDDDVESRLSKKTRTSTNLKAEGSTRSAKRKRNGCN